MTKIGKTNYVTQQQLKTMRGGPGIGHVHSNKETLDAITQELLLDMAEAIMDAHTHENRDAIDLFQYDPQTNTVFLGNEENRINIAVYGDMASGGRDGSEPEPSSGALYSLADVYHSGLNILRADGTPRQEGDALVFNALLSKWVAAVVSGGGAGAAVWGNITGSLINQADLADALAAFLPLTGGTLTGNLLISRNGGELQMRTVSAPESYYSIIRQNYNAAKPFEIISNGYTILYTRFLSPFVIDIAPSANEILGIGTDNPDRSAKLHVVGNIVATGDLATGSDRRWKENIIEITDFEDTLKKLRPCEWDWKKGHGKGHSAGFIAQEVAKILPYAVKGSRSRGYTLNYNVFHAFEIKALQEQAKEIKALKDEVAEIKKTLKKLTESYGEHQ